MELEEYVDKVMEELNRYKIGNTRLSEIFDALLQACESEAKTPKELQDCVAEGIATLKSALRNCLIHRKATHRTVTHIE